MPRQNFHPSRSICVRATIYALVILAAVLSLSPAFTRLTVLAQSESAADDSGDVQPLAEFVRALSLPASDVVYNPADKMLYASVPSSAGTAGNSIVSINPATGEIGAPVFVGSEPNRLAMSDDGHTLYVSLDGSHTIRRFDTATRLPGQQFALGQNSMSGIHTASYIAVAPGNPNLLAVARSSIGSGTPGGAGVAVYDNGVQRTKTGPDWYGGASFLAFSATESKLYGSGTSSGLQTLAIDASGVTVIPDKAIPDVRSRIVFADGLIYSSTGQVANPETSKLLGTFSGVSTSAFAVDTVAGRAYYLMREGFSSGALTLKAFDLDTFVPTGTASISGITGEPASMVRWGANGLAFRTDTGRLYLIQTSLIPSSEAIPSPTPFVSPTPTPTPPSVPTFVRQIPLLANDLIYSAQSQQLYASVPSAAGAKGNSVTRLNPETGEIGPSIFVGSEPTRLALADDGQTMYVSLSAAGAVRKLDVSAQTAGIRFNLGNSTYDGPFLADDIAVMPGNPGTVAVSKLKSYDSAVTIYDEGVPRAQSINQGGPVEFASTTRLYAGSTTVQKVNVDANGLTRLSSFNTGTSGQTQLAGGLLYLSGGTVVDPENGVIKGRFSGLGSYSVMTIDAAKNRAFFLTSNFSSAYSLRSYELDTFRPVASVVIQGVSTGSAPDPSSLVRWGKNGLAFRASGRIFLIQSALVDTSEPVPAATPTPSPTPSPTPVYIPTIVDKVNLPANDLVINAATQTLYASVPSTAGEGAGNSITSIDPKTGTIGTSTFIGSEPNKLALSDDGQVLYVNLDGAKAIRRFETATKAPGAQFTIGVDRPLDMEVVPGSPQSLVVSRGMTFGVSGGVAVYDNGVQRPNTSNSGSGYFYSSVGPIEFGATPAKLYGYNNGSTGFEITKMELDASGIKTTGVLRNLLSGFVSGFEFAGGRLYSASGGVADPETETLVGKFNTGGAMFVDQALGRVFFLSSTTNSNIVLTAYDINTFLPLGSVTLPNVNGTPASLVRWGTNGLAFCTLPNTFGSPATPGQIYLVRSALVSDAEPLPSVLGFGAATYNVSEVSGGMNAVVNVTRTGGLAGATTINYATSGGTATPGSDYTETSGTLSFADGEMSKTFTVRIADDNLFEGSVRETINLTLSSPTGNARLGSQTTATLTIQDNDGRPTLNAGSMSVPEGQSGTTEARFTVRLSNPSIEVISVNYATADRTATAPSDYVAASGTLTFQPGEVEKTIPLQIKGDTVDEGDEQFAINFTNPVNVSIFGATGLVTILVDERSVFRFSAPEFAAGEGDGRATITVVRVGANTETASVGYLTLDDARAIRCDDNTASREAAFARCDYMTTFDTLVFAPGESQKTFTVPLVDDGHDEPREFVPLRLTTPAGATLAAPSSALLLIADNDEANQPNPVDAHNFFVRQHYLDFLSREPDAEGLTAWTGVLAGCANAFNTDASNPAALCDRNVVSSSFFRSTEFELKGYFVYRFYRVAFNRRPSYDEFVADMRRVTGQTAEEVYARRRGFGEAWVLRPEFLDLYAAKTNAVYVDALLGRYGLTAINTADPANPDGDTLQRFTRDELVAALDAAPQRLTRAQVLRAVVQSREIEKTEYNGAFVAMQYYGYLRRAPEADGYEAWLTVITRGDGYRVMVNGFMNSTEYRLRFGQ